MPPSASRGCKNKPADPGGCVPHGLWSYPARRRSQTVSHRQILGCCDASRVPRSMLHWDARGTPSEFGKEVGAKYTHGAAHLIPQMWETDGYGPCRPSRLNSSTSCALCSSGSSSSVSLSQLDSVAAKIVSTVMDLLAAHRSDN